MALKKPSEYFKKDVPSVDNSVLEIAKAPELNTFSDAFQSFKSNLEKIEVLSDFSETLDNYRVNVERVNHLSEKIEDIQKEVQGLLTKEDLDRAMMSQLLVVEQSILDVQKKVKAINQEDITEIRSEVSRLTESVNDFLSVDVPQYKKLIVDSELRTDARFSELEGDVSETLNTFEIFISQKYTELTENLKGINEASLSSILQEFSLVEESFQKLIQEDIPKYKGFIVENERKTSSKISEFQEKFDTSLSETLSQFDQTVKEVLDKISIVEETKTDLYEQVNQKIKEVQFLSDQVYKLFENNDDFKEDINKKVSDLHVEIIRNESHIRVQNKNLEQIQENVKNTLKQINIEGIEAENYKLSEKIKYLEEVFQKFSEKEILTEELTIAPQLNTEELTEPPSTKNQDPLTPLDKNYVTFDQLQQHYRTFINRIQQQLASIGGGGETRLEFLDDVDRNSAKQDGYVLQYSSNVGKFIGTSYVPGGGGNVAIAITSTPPGSPSPGNLWYDDTIGRMFIYYQDVDGSQWVDPSPSGVINIPQYWSSNNSGIHTLSSVGIGTTNPTSTLEVQNGDIRVGVNTSSGVVLTSPNGTMYRLIVNDSGVLSTVIVV